MARFAVAHAACLLTLYSLATCVGDFLPLTTAARIASRSIVVRERYFSIRGSFNKAAKWPCLLGFRFCGLLISRKYTDGFSYYTALRRGRRELSRGVEAKKRFLGGWHTPISKPVMIVWRLHIVTGPRANWVFLNVHLRSRHGRSVHLPCVLVPTHRAESRIEYPVPGMHCWRVWNRSVWSGRGSWPSLQGVAH